MVRRSARLGADAALKKTSTAQSKNAATKPEAKPVAQVKSEAKVRSSTGKKRRRGLEDQQSIWFTRSTCPPYMRIITVTTAGSAHIIGNTRLFKPWGGGCEIYKIAFLEVYRR